MQRVLTFVQGVAASESKRLTFVKKKINRFSSDLSAKKVASISKASTESVVTLSDHKSTIRKEDNSNIREEVFEDVIA